MSAVPPLLHSPVAPNPIQASAPPSDRRLSLLITVLTYGVIIWWVRDVLLAPRGPVPAPKAAPAAPKIFVFDFSQIKEVPPPPAPGPSGDAGGASAPALPGAVQEAAMPQAMAARPEAFDDLSVLPDLAPGTPLAAASGPATAAGGRGGTGSGGGGTGTGTGQGGGGKAPQAEPVSGIDLEVDEHIKPDYPVAAIKARIEGFVTVRMEVNDRGRPTKVWVVSGHPIFHESVIAAFKRYRFRNLKDRGIPTPAIIEIPVWFHFKY